MSPFYRCLADLDVAAAFRLHDRAFPHLPKPRNNHEALATMHYARTGMDGIGDRARCYSHAWLLDHNLPSNLPDRLKARADRLYPRVVGAVGISVNAKSDIMKPVTGLVRGAMENAVADRYANGDEEPDIVRAAMVEARRAAIKKLLGI